MIHIAIVDNDSMFSNILKKQVVTFMETIFTTFEIEIVKDMFLTNINKKEYDVVFLNIDVKEVCGIITGKISLLLKNNPVVIFISSRKELTNASLPIQPFYFVRKSNLEEDVVTMFVLLEKYIKEKMTFFTFEFHGRKTNLFLKDIFILESRKHNIIVRTKEGDYTYRSTMQHMLDVLGGEKIIQIQKSYAVNIDYIKEINKGIIYLKNKEQYTMGRKFKETVMQTYKERRIQSSTGNKSN